MSTQPPSAPSPNDDPPPSDDASAGAGAAGRRPAKKRSAKVSEASDATASLDDEVAGLVSDLSGDGDGRGGSARLSDIEADLAADAARPSPARASKARDTSKSVGGTGKRGRPAAARDEARSRSESSGDGPEGATLAPPEDDAPELRTRAQSRSGADAGVPGTASSGRRGLSGADLAGLGGIAAILVALAVFLFGFADRSVVNDRSNRPTSSPDAPVRGELVALDTIEAFWRPRSEDDRVDRRFGVLPSVRLGLDKATPQGTHYLKIHFLDTDGEIAGDVRTARVENGRFIDTSRGEQLESPQVVSVTGTAGMVSETAFVAYRFSDESRWSVEVFEGDDYAAGPWTRIAWFEMPGDLRDSGASGGAP